MATPQAPEPRTPESLLWRYHPYPNLGATVAPWMLVLWTLALAATSQRLMPWTISNAAVGEPEPQTLAPPPAWILESQSPHAWPCSRPWGSMAPAQAPTHQTLLPLPPREHHKLDIVPREIHSTATSSVGKKENRKTLMGLCNWISQQPTLPCGYPWPWQQNTLLIELHGSYATGSFLEPEPPLTTKLTPCIHP